MAAPNEYSDKDLADLLKSGDQAAFTEVYDRHWGSLYLHALKMLQNEDEAKDIVQEVFISLWNKASELEISSSLTAYLFASTRHKILNQIRNSKARQGYIDLFSLYIDEHQNATALEYIQEKELVAAIEDVINSLPAKMKEVFELSRKEHLSHKEIAQKLNISDKTVKRQVSNALAILRSRLNKPEALILAVLLGHIK